MDGALQAFSIAADRDFVAAMAGGLTAAEAAAVIGQTGRAAQIMRRAGVVAAIREQNRYIIDGTLLPITLQVIEKALLSPEISPTAVAALSRVVLSAAGMLTPTAPRTAPPGDPEDAPPGADVPRLGQASESALRAMQGELAGMSQRLHAALRSPAIEGETVPDPLG